MCSCMPKSDPGFLKNLPPHDRSCGWQHLAAVSDDRHGYAIKKGHEIAARGDSYQRNRKNCMLADFSVLSSCMASFCLNVGTRSLCFESFVECLYLPWGTKIAILATFFVGSFSFLFWGMQVGESGLRSQLFIQDAHCTLLNTARICQINLGISVI